MVKLKPSLQFVLILKNENKNNYQKEPSSQITIWADGFDVKENGSIVFYQIIDSKRKISVAAYSEQKWENCLLLNLNNSFCAFNQTSNINLNLNSQVNNLNLQNNTKTFNSSQNSSNNNSSNNNSQGIEDGFNDFNMFEEQNPNNQTNNSHYNNTVPYPVQNYHTPNNQMSIPGFNQNNQHDYREIKNSIIEKEIIKYIQNYPAFNQEEFMPILSKAASNASVKIDEDSALWFIANMLKKDKISVQKFFIVDKKSILDMHLKPILNRHWSGPDTKLTSILKILQDRDETKEITIVDLVSWLKYNKYFDK